MTSYSWSPFARPHSNAHSIAQASQAQCNGKVSRRCRFSRRQGLRRPFDFSPMHQAYHILAIKFEHPCDILCYTSNCRANGGAAVFASKRPSMSNRLTTSSRSSSNCIAVFAKRRLRLETLRPIAISLGKLAAKRQLPQRSASSLPRSLGFNASRRFAALAELYPIRYT